MPKIAGFEVAVFQGYMPNPHRRQEEEIIPGVDGQTVILGAWSSPEATIRTTMVLATKEEATSRKRALLRLITHSVLVEDQFGEHYENTYIARVETHIFGIANGTWEVITDWTMRVNAKAPEGYEE